MSFQNSLLEKSNLLLILFILILSILLIITTSIQRRINKRLNYILDLKKFYLKKLLLIEKKATSLEQRLEWTDILLKEFLWQKFKIEKNKDYYEAYYILKEKNKTLASNICKIMGILLYSGKTLSQEDIETLSQLIKLLIIEEENLENILPISEFYKTIEKPKYIKEGVNPLNNLRIKKENEQIIIDKQKQETALPRDNQQISDEEKRIMEKLKEVTKKIKMFDEKK
ncbi:MAG: hypothetical protein QXU40_01230 [Candidatus Pacearchaeota archaeon]